LCQFEENAKNLAGKRKREENDDELPKKKRKPCDAGDKIKKLSKENEKLKEAINTLKNKQKQLKKESSALKADNKKLVAGAKKTPKLPELDRFKLRNSTYEADNLRGKKKQIWKVKEFASKLSRKADSLLKKVDEELEKLPRLLTTCSVCKEQHTEKTAKVQPCGHFLCNECASRISEKKCPECRKQWIAAPHAVYTA